MGALAAAIEAYERNDWKRGYELLKQALTEDPDAPEILAPLGDCASWLQLHDESIECRERAYRAFYGRGDWASAARMAVLLCLDYAVTRGQPAVSSGWLQRAAELLEGKPLTSAHGELELRRGLREGDANAALSHLDAAVAIAREVGDHDVEVRALAAKGMVLVGKGETDEGFGLLDAALAAAMGGELSLDSTIRIYCWLIACCERVGDIGRASEWSDVALRYCNRNSIRSFPGACRLHRTRVLRLRGAWADAETEARLAAEESRPTNRDVYGSALGEIAELRRRHGDVEGAWELAQQAVLYDTMPEPFMALVVWDREGPEAAYYRLEKTLRSGLRDRFLRCRIIPTFVEVAIALAKVEALEEHVHELEDLAARAGTDVLRAQAQGSRGRLQFSRGELESARASLEEAVAAWTAAGAPFECARDRLALAEVLLAAGNRVGAEVEAREALRCFEELGGKKELDRALTFLARASVAEAPPTTNTLMFTDLADSTALVELIGDEAWRDLSAWVDGELRRLFAEHGGREIDHAGDGFFVTFDSARAAIHCAVAVQRRLLAHRREHGYAPKVRVGIHVGEVRPLDTALRGAAVHRASRICALAQGGEILASKDAFEAAAWPTEGLRQVRLKGVRETVEVGEVPWTAMKTSPGR